MADGRVRALLPYEDDPDPSPIGQAMVETLDAKLTENPDNLQGWLGLVRSYAVMGDRAAATKALERAGDTFPAESDDGRILAQLAAELGLEPGLEGQ